MACDLDVLKNVPLFALLDDEEPAVLAGQIESRKFAAQQRIYKMADRPGAYIVGCIYGLGPVCKRCRSSALR